MDLFFPISPRSFENRWGMYGEGRLKMASCGEGEGW